MKIRQIFKKFTYITIIISETLQNYFQNVTNFCKDFKGMWNSFPKIVEFEKLLKKWWDISGDGGILLQKFWEMTNYRGFFEKNFKIPKEFWGRVIIISSKIYQKNYLQILENVGNVKAIFTNIRLIF